MQSGVTSVANALTTALEADLLYATAVLHCETELNSVDREAEIDPLQKRMPRLLLVVQCG
jgi:hypothetical protein